MRRVLMLTVLLMMFATPALAQTSTYPPPPPTTVPPPVCVNPPCYTADTGSDAGPMALMIVGLLGIGGGLLLLRKRG